MCRVGDIILIDSFKDEEGNLVNSHPFIVIDDEADKIQGLEFDLLTSMLGSFHDDDHKRKVLQNPCNIEVERKDGVAKAGYIKSDRLHYFRKDIKHHVLGSITPELFNNLLDMIEDLEKEDCLLINTSNI